MNTTALLLLAPALLGAQSAASLLLPAAPPERCSPITQSVGTAAQWLNRAAARVLPAKLDGKVLRYRATHDQPLWEQSDRAYEPFIPNAPESFFWYNPATNVEARQSVTRPLASTQYPSLLFGDTTSFIGRDSVVTPMEAAQPFGAVIRRMNPWIVLAAWRGDTAHVRVAERPYSTFRRFDGVTYERQGILGGTPIALIPVDSAPRLAIPAVPAMSDRLASPATTTDTVRVSAQTVLLVSPIYTETVTLQRDTVFLLDATSGEARGRQDSTWIAKLFPGRHPIVVVVTDLAWPHISSVRYWVARGATIVSYRQSQDFLTRIVERRWTLSPDALERARASASFRFRAVDDSLRLGGGAVVVHALRGSSTEGALSVWLPADRYLWAGDGIQPSPSSPYYYDVVNTVRGLGLHPLTVGAQHTPLLDWSLVDQRVPR